MDVYSKLCNPGQKSWFSECYAWIIEALIDTSIILTLSCPKRRVYDQRVLGYSPAPVKYRPNAQKSIYQSCTLVFLREIDRVSMTTSALVQRDEAMRLLDEKLQWGLIRWKQQMQTLGKVARLIKIATLAVHTHTTPHSPDTPYTLQYNPPGHCSLPT